MAGPARRPLALRRLPTYSGGVVRVDTTNGLVGTELAGYLIESVLGRGGMGVVYLAEHRRLKRKVALKVLAPERADNERFRRRFLEESRIAAGLNHPNVIPIHDADEADGVLFLAMRYVEEADLRTLLAQDGPLEPGARAADRRPGRQRARRRSRAPARPPRRHRRERPRQCGRPRLPVRLRPLEAQLIVGFRALRARRGARHRRVHRPGANRARGCRPERRYLLARLPALPGA